MSFQKIKNVVQWGTRKRRLVLRDLSSATLKRLRLDKIQDLLQILGWNKTPNISPWLATGEFTIWASATTEVASLTDLGGLPPRKTFFFFSLGLTKHFKCYQLQKQHSFKPMGKEPIGSKVTIPKSCAPFCLGPLFWANHPLKIKPSSSLCIPCLRWPKLFPAAWFGC